VKAAALVAIAACASAPPPVRGVDGTGSKVEHLTWVVDSEPWWSPDGAHVVLISSRHGGMNVHVLPVAGGDNGAAMVQLTHDVEDDSPSWSPDGAHIAYVSVRDGVSQIYVMNADGSEQHAVTTGTAENIHPAWTPDGARVLFDTTAFAAQVKAHDSARYRIGDPTDEAMDLATVRWDGGDLRPLTHGGGYTYASYSPDGRWIVSRRIRGPRSTIVVMSADGSGLREVSGDGAGWPSWSPDGARIVFAQAARGTMQIFVMNRDGSGVRQLTDEDGRFTNPRWSPDGKTILCSRRLGDMTLVTFPAPAP
jgi:TolB protein